MNILFYFPTNKPSVSLETLMQEFGKKGHKVFLLGWEEKGPIHNTVEKFGVSTENYNIAKSPSYKFYWKQIRFLNQYMRKHQIDLVYAHTQPVNFVAVFAQYFVKAKFYICRHHSDYIQKEGNKNALMFDRIINKLGKAFIVPSKKVFHQLTAVEGVDPIKVRLINYAYNFDHYPKPDRERVKELREKHPAKLHLVAVSRFIPCKRYDILIATVAGLIDQGFDIQINILGEGPLLNQAKDQVEALNMNNHIHFIGYTSKVIDYMDAADIVVHFSDSEASNSVVKEAGLIKKIVAVCEDVGDFDDYIENEVHGFKLSKANPAKDFERVVKQVYGKRQEWDYLGEKLKESVLQNFSVEHVIGQYKEIA